MTDQEKLDELVSDLTKIFSALGFRRSRCLDWVRMMDYEHYEDSSHICLSVLHITNHHGYWDVVFSWDRTGIYLSRYDTELKRHDNYHPIAVPNGSGGWNLCDPGAAEDRGQQA